MGILRASNSQAPQRDLAHGCSCSAPGPNQTAPPRFRCPRVRLGMLPNPGPAGNLEGESPVAPFAAARWEDGGEPSTLHGRRFIPWGMGWAKPPPDFSQRFQLFPINREQPGDEAGKGQGEGKLEVFWCRLFTCSSLSTPAAGRQIFPSSPSCLLSLAENCAVPGTGTPDHLHPPPPSRGAQTPACNKWQLHQLDFPHRHLHKLSTR